MTERVAGGGEGVGGVGGVWGGAGHRVQMLKCSSSRTFKKSLETQTAVPRGMHLQGDGSTEGDD